MPDQDDTLLQHVRDHVAQVAPRWTATIERATQQVHEARMELGLAHPYSAGNIIVSGPGLADAPHADQLRWVENVLTFEDVRREIELLADAPDPPQNPRTVLGLRLHAELFAWSAIEVRCLAGMFEGAGALSHEEWQWVQRKIGEDAIDRPGPNEMAMRWRWRTPTEPFGPRDARRLIESEPKLPGPRPPGMPGPARRRPQPPPEHP